jgi:hypothetical protein
MVEYLEVGSWGHSIVDVHLLEGLVAGGQLTTNTDPDQLMWIVPSDSPRRGTW